MVKLTWLDLQRHELKQRCNSECCLIRLQSQWEVVGEINEVLKCKGGEKEGDISEAESNCPPICGDNVSKLLTAQFLALRPCTSQLIFGKDVNKKSRAELLTGIFSWSPGSSLPPVASYASLVAALLSWNRWEMECSYWGSNLATSLQKHLIPLFLFLFFISYRKTLQKSQAMLDSILFPN